MLNFIGFINDNVNLSMSQKLALLEDFCTQYGYQEVLDDGSPNPESRREFANHHITRFLRESVNSVRRERAEAEAMYEELKLEAT